MADCESRDGRTYLTHGILEYVELLHVSHDEALDAAFSAPARIGLSPIQVSRSEGKFIGMLLQLSGAKRVVEIGTLLGYSAIHIGRSLPSDGHLWTIEISERCAVAATEHLAAAGLEERVTVVRGYAKSALSRLECHGPFDAVFVDADKDNYHQYGRWAAANLRRGGILLADNAFFFGQLLRNADDASDVCVGGVTISAEKVAHTARAMRRFHEETGEEFDTVCLPTPDGLVLGIRK